jgi:dUTP pyrophosphatase
MSEDCECCYCCDDPDLQVHLSAGADFQAPRSGDAGFDLRALEDAVINPNEQLLVATGVRVAIPQGWVGIVKDRSSMALKQIYTHAGVIDAAYRGEVKIVLSNAGATPYVIEKGAKIAQMVVVPCLTKCVTVENIEDLGETERGAGGFGSTGVN